MLDEDERNKGAGMAAIKCGKSEDEDNQELSEETKGR